MGGKVLVRRHFARHGIARHAVAPVLADEVFSLAVQDLKMPERQEETYSEFNSWPAPPLARYPWEDAEWFRAS
jgi:predicted branched-subunit amino acid permease